MDWNSRNLDCPSQPTSPPTIRPGRIHQPPILRPTSPKLSDEELGRGIPAWRAAHASSAGPSRAPVPISPYADVFSPTESQPGSSVSSPEAATSRSAAARGKARESKEKLETVGSILADIANLMTDGLRIMDFSEKIHWGQDEHEQLRALERALDEAKKDFQELSPLVNGQFYYENDKRYETLQDLRRLRSQFESHIQNFRDWARSGGPINPSWAKETSDLHHALHRAQCRAARRIYTTDQVTGNRCLGAFLVFRKQRTATTNTLGNDADDTEFQRRHVEELVACNSVGKFERFGDHDIAFVCDFCDGFIVWPNLDTMPSLRAAHDGSFTQRPSPAFPRAQNTDVPPWQATGFSASSHQEKPIVFAPVAIANHAPPEVGEWLSRLVCPYCDEEYSLTQGDGEMEQVRYVQDENGFEDLRALQEHLTWAHGVSSVPNINIGLPSSKTCVVM